MNRFRFKEDDQDCSHYSIGIIGTDVNCQFGDRVERVSGCRNAYFIYNGRDRVAVLPYDKWELCGVTKLEEDK